MFSQQHADVACNFFEKVLKHTADKWYGKPFLLAPWQEEAISQIFGNIDEQGQRIIETAYLEIPKKSGKTELVSGIVLLVLFLEAMKGCQIYGAGAATRQALNAYRAAAKMVEQSSILKKRFRVLRSTNRILKRSDPDSFYAAIAADGDLGDGVNPAVVVADEVHRWKTRKQLENWDVLSNGGITRKQTLTIAITTAGVQNESPLAWRLHEKTKRIAEGIVADPKFYGRIYGADPDDDPAADATYIKACPSLKENGGFLDIEKIREKYRSHVAEGDLTSFKRYFLNLWDQKESRAFSMHDWDASAGDWRAVGLLPDPGPIVIDGKAQERKVRPFPSEYLQRFFGRRCWSGVDLSMTTDLTSAVFLFPSTEPDTYEVLPFFWMPAAKLREIQTKLGVPLQQWVDQGFLELCPGRVVDYRDIQKRLEWGRQMFDLQEVCFDKWNSRQISAYMTDDGFSCVEVQQTYLGLSEATKKILTTVAQAKLHHGQHPILRWNAGCAAFVTDGKDNKMFAKPDREKSTSRIDGLSALANAMAYALIDETKTGYTRVYSAS